MIQRLPQFDVIESHSCGEQLHQSISFTSSTCTSRYLTKMCDQVVALLSPEDSKSIVWNDEDSDSDSVDVDTGNTDRLFTFEVTKTNEQEENAIASPGFQVPIPFVVGIPSPNASKMHCRHISHNTTPPDCLVDPAVLIPRLLPGETVQGILTPAYIPRQCHIEEFRRQSFSRMSLKQLL